MSSETEKDETSDHSVQCKQTLFNNICTIAMIEVMYVCMYREYSKYGHTHTISHNNKISKKKRNVQMARSNK